MSCMSCNQLSFLPQGLAVQAISDDADTPSFSADRLANRRVMLNASNGSLGPLPNSPLHSPLNIVSTSINTQRIGPTDNLINFCGILYLPAGASVNLIVQVRRISAAGQSIFLGGAFSLVRNATAAQSDTFNFQVFDPDVQPGNYTYSAELSDNSTISGNLGPTICNAVFSVLAVSNRS